MNTNTMRRGHNQNDDLRITKINQEYHYSMFSTLNQMVNYLPMLCFDFQLSNLYFTQGGAQNESFDKNLVTVCEDNGLSFPKSKVKIENINDIADIKPALKQESRGFGKILWNLTGGQRPLVMATLELIKEERQEDMVLYLEGNQGVLSIHQLGTNGEWSDFLSLDTNKFSKLKDDGRLNIVIALKLMGFEINTRYEKYAPKNIADIKYVCKQYVGKDDALRVKLIQSNKRNDEARKNFEAFDQPIQNLINKYPDKTYPFGHLLEEMFTFLIYEHAGSRLIELGTNVKLEDPYSNIEGTVDEMDIVALTPSGRLIIFECKSGKMTGDVAKSTKYSTYAVAGVYGKPVLLPALLKDDVINVKDRVKNELYEANAKAVISAQRAKLPILCLDGDPNTDRDFEQALEQILFP